MDDRPEVSPRTAALLAALLLCLAAANLWWLANDRHPWWLDEQVHLEKTREVYQALFLGDAPLPARVAAAFRVPPGNPAHPPLLYWSGALLMGVFGYHPDIMTAANTLWFLLLLLGVFALLRTWLPPGEALWGAALAGLTPGVFALSRYFMTDYPAACLVVWGVCALARSKGFARTRWVLCFAGVNALALLARTVAPAYYLAPLLWALAAGAWAALRGTRTDTDQHGRDTDEAGSEGPGAAPPGTARLQPGRAGRLHRVLRFALHLSLPPLAALLLAGPWYAVHRDAFLGYWTGHRAADTPPFAFVETSAPATPRTGLTQMAEQAQGKKDRKPAAAKPKPQPARGPLDRVLRPAVPWSRYPVFVINNGLFLIPFLLALAGFVAALAVPRFRRMAGFLGLWVLGSWVLFTLLFRFGTPRYALPVLPALAVFAALPALLPRRRAVRWACQGACLAVFAVPWFVLTVHPLPGLGGLCLPLAPDAGSLARYDEKGLYLCKDRLSMGFAYSWIGAPQRDNYVERIFAVMAAETADRPDAPGQDALYAVVNLRGFGFQDAHYRPGDPFRLAGLPEARLRLGAHRNTVEELEPFLSSLRFVIFALETGREGGEAAWTEWLTGRGFHLLDRFEEPRRATVPGYLVAVFARNPEPGARRMTPEQVDAADIPTLFTALNTPGALPARADADRAAARLTALLAEADKTAQPLGGALGLTAHAWGARPGGGLRLTLVFRVTAAPGSGTIALAPRDAAGISLGAAQFRPAPPMTEWLPGDYRMVRHDFPADTPAPAQVQVALIGPNGAPAPPAATVPGPPPEK